MNINYVKKIQFVLLVITIQFVLSAIPQTIAYQGFLADTLGNPKPDGNYSITFSLYDSEDGSTTLWSQIDNLYVRQGMFATFLGSKSPFTDDITFNKPYWLGISVNGALELKPRVPITSVGYCFYALRADTAHHVDGKNVHGKVALAQKSDTAQVAKTSIAGKSDTALYSLNSKTLNGQLGTFYQNASNIVGGKLHDTCLSVNISKLGQTIESSELLDGTISRADVASTFKAPYADTSDVAKRVISSGSGVSTDTIVATAIKAKDVKGLKLENSKGQGAIIDSSGNMGLGLSTPGEKLHVGDGHILIEGGGETSLMMKRDVTYTGGPSGESKNPIFMAGRITQAGDGDPEYRFLYKDDNTTEEKTVFEFDRKGIVASVKPGYGSHFEGFIGGEPEPLFRLNSYPSMQLELGGGGDTLTDVIIRRSFANTLSFLTGGTERMRINPNGFIGIGTDNPVRKFHIVTSEGSPSSLRLEAQSSTNNANVELFTNDYKWGVYNRNNGNDQFQIMDVTKDSVRLAISKNGNIGIGTTNPKSNLHIDGRNYHSHIYVDGNSGWNHGFTHALSNDPIWTTQIVGDGTNRYRIYGYNDNIEAFSILPNGNIGIGTDTPHSKLHIKEDSKSEFEGTDINYMGSNIVLEGSEPGRTPGRGPSLTFAFPTSTQGEGLWEQARILATPENSSSNSAQGRLYLQVRDMYNPPGVGGTWNWRTGLMISSSGNVGIESTNPQYKLDVNGTIRGNNVAPSDKRYKKEIIPLKDLISSVSKLQGVSFLWNNDKFPEKCFPPGKQFGFLAQDVEEVFPELVKTDGEGFKCLSYDKLTAVLVEAIKEQQTQIESYKEKLDKQQNQIDALFSHIGLDAQ